MLVFPNCKLNLGLYVTEKRPDGFHNIETVFYPLNWCDALEIIEGKASDPSISLSGSGIEIDGKLEGNLVYKAWELVCRLKKLPHLKVHLHKNVPMGAGLGGGSSDAAFFIKSLDQKFSLGLSKTELSDIASQLGSDCAFFIENKPVLAFGKGNEFSDVKIDLSKYYILAVHPAIHSNTKEAYAGLTPKKPITELRSIIEIVPVTDWKNTLVNDFETSIFKKYPAIANLKQQLYDSGAVYASMSGSGSAVFGLFAEKPEINFPADFKYFLQNPASKIL